MTDQLPPYSEESEMALLGCIMLSFAIINEVKPRLPIEAIYLPHHQVILKAMYQISDQDGLTVDARPVDVIALSNQLKRNNDLELCGGFLYLNKLTDNVATPTNWSHYLEVVLTKYTQRRLLNLLLPKINELYLDHSKDEADQIIDSIYQNLVEIQHDSGSSEIKSPRQLMRSTAEYIEWLAENKGKLVGLPTGLKDLDKRLGGLRKATYIVLAGRPRTGKSILMMNIADHLGIQHKVPVLVFSLEMTLQQINFRRVAAEARVNMKKIEEGLCGQGEFDNIVMAMQKLSDAPVSILERDGITIEELESTARHEARSKKIQLVMIDHVGKIDSKAKYKDRTARLYHISHRLNCLKKELNIPIVALAHVNREADKRSNPRPRMGDLADADAFARDCDQLMLTHRPSLIDIEQKDNGEADLAELIIDKDRCGGKEGVERLVFLGKYARFECRYEGENQ